MPDQVGRAGAQADEAKCIRCEVGYCVPLSVAQADYRADAAHLSLARIAIDVPVERRFDTQRFLFNRRKPWMMRGSGDHERPRGEDPVGCSSRPGSRQLRIQAHYHLFACRCTERWTVASSEDLDRRFVV